MDHDQLVDLIFEKPDLIEKGAKSLYKNFPIHDSKLDVLLKGEDGAVVVVEVKIEEDPWKGPAKQVKRYIDVLIELCEKLFNLKPEIRGYIAVPESWRNKTLQPFNEIKGEIPELTYKRLINKFAPEIVKENDVTLRVKYIHGV